MRGFIVTHLPNISINNSASRWQWNEEIAWVWDSKCLHVWDRHVSETKAWHLFFPNEAASQLKSHLTFRFLQFTLPRKKRAPFHHCVCKYHLGKYRTDDCPLRGWIDDWSLHTVSCEVECQCGTSLLCVFIQLAAHGRRNCISPNLIHVSWCWALSKMDHTQWSRGGWAGGKRGTEREPKQRKGKSLGMVSGPRLTRIKYVKLAWGKLFAWAGKRT